MYQGHLRSDTTPLALNVFVFHAMPSSCPMDGSHCLLVLNIFCPLGLQVSLVQHPPSLVFAVCIFCNSSNPDLRTKLHRPCHCVFFCTIQISWDSPASLTASLSSGLTTPSIRSSLLLGVCSSGGDDVPLQTRLLTKRPHTLDKQSSFISRHCRTRQPSTTGSLD